MSPTWILLIIAAYFLLLYTIAHYTSRQASTSDFFSASKSVPWYLVAFGMIGTSLSGVTFISVPGKVGVTHWSYMQVVLGYLLGYAVIGGVLMPLYYRLNLVSIYTWLEQRFGFYSYKTGAFFFLLSRTLGSGARFFLVINVLQFAVFEPLGVPFALTVAGAIALIWVYTFRGGIKTIVYTDTLQTFFMLLCVGISIYLISEELHTSLPGLVAQVWESPLSQIFHWDWASKDYFWKQFFSGAFIAIVMTGLDQDMMQKNLTCRSIGEAQKNMFWFTLTLTAVNLLFMILGAGLYLYAAEKGIQFPAGGQTDQFFPYLALNQFAPLAGLVFILGIIAATYASTDSALTALTTSFCVDFLDFAHREESERLRLKFRVHLGFSILLLLVVLGLKAFNNQALIDTIFKLAGYTYGPLLGLYAFGLFSRRAVRDGWVPLLAMAAPLLSWLLALNSVEWLGGYQFGFEILLVNGLFMYLGLWAISRPALSARVP